MRKISIDAAHAFKGNVNFYRDNTQVIVLKNKTLFYLFGNLIAIKKDGYLYINNCGYTTRVTHDRLNAIFCALGMQLVIKRKNYQSLLLKNNLVITKAVHLKYKGKFMAKKKFPQQVLDAAVAHYSANKDSLLDVARIYGISASTLYRELANKGLRVSKYHKTKAEEAMLKYLEQKGITDLSQLQAKLW